ncbi:MAG: methyltransferase domain-containing protein [Candidatus Omnitrophota bacterium]
MSINSVLKNINEIEEAFKKIKENGLYLPVDKVKSWDQWRSFDFITSQSQKDARILEVGSWKSRILPSLYFSGYRNLYSCDLCGIEWRMVVVPFLKKRNYADLLRSIFGFGPIRQSQQDLLKTNYPDLFFDYILSLSVIEHGIDLEKYCCQMHRLLKPGGYLITSCDYWTDEVDTTGKEAFGFKWRIFNRQDIESLIITAGNYGLEIIEPLDFSCPEPVLEWQGKRYTFIFFIMRKVRN